MDCAIHPLRESVLWTVLCGLQASQLESLAARLGVKSLGFRGFGFRGSGFRVYRVQSE